MENIGASERKYISETIDSIFLQIEKSVEKDLNNGGDGCTERVINDSKFSVDDVLNGAPLDLYGKSYAKKEVFC